MELNSIKQLIAKYENAETTLQEEQRLKHYFTNETVLPELEVYKPLFAYFATSQQEQFTKDVPLKTKRKLNYKWISVAAVAVLMLGVYLGKGAFKNEPQYTEAQAQADYNDMVEALQLVSENFNKGKASVGYLEEMDNATSLIFKK